MVSAGGWNYHTLKDTDLHSAGAEIELVTTNPALVIFFSLVFQWIKNKILNCFFTFSECKSVSLEMQKRFFKCLYPQCC